MDNAGGQGIPESSGGSISMPSLPGGSGGNGLPSGEGGGLGPQYQIVDTSGWPMLNRDDPAAPTGGWIIDPVVVDPGEQIFHSRDLIWSHGGTFLAADRLYRHKTPNRGGTTVDFGRNFNTNLRVFVDSDGRTADQATVHLGNGEQLVFDGQQGVTTYTTVVGWERYLLEKLGSTQYRLTDKNGYAYYFEPSSDPANLISTRNRYDRGEDYSYDQGGYLTKVTLSTADEVNLDRDTAHAITLIRDYAGRSVHYQYDAGNLVSAWGDFCASCSAVAYTGYAYDGSNRITEVKDGNNATVRRIAYDGSNRVDYSVNANNRTFDFAYNGTDFAVDPEGNTTGYIFDGSGRPTTKILGYGSANAATYRYAYDSSNRVTGATLPNGAVVSNTYDSRGDVLSTVVTADSTSITTFRAEYQQDYSLPTKTYDPLGSSTTYTYDGSGSLITIVRPDDSLQQYWNNEAGQVTHYVAPNDEAQAYEYDTRGFLVTLTVDPSSESQQRGAGGALDLQTIYTVDSLGRVLTTESPEHHKVTTEYNMAGKLTKQTSAAGIVTQYEYDSNLRPTARKIMDGQTPLYTWSTAYDNAGLVLSTIAPGSLTTTYAYDKAGRMTKETAPDGRVTERVFDSLGRAVTTKLGDVGGTSIMQTLTYDSLGNVVSSKDAENNAMVHTYDGFGRRKTTADPIGHYGVYEYDGASRQTAVKGYNSGNTLLSYSKTEYSVLGQVTKTRQKADPGGADGSSDGLTELLYDGADRVSLQIAWYDVSNASTTDNDYDGAGRLVKVTDPDGFDTTYYYDDDGLRTTARDANSHDTFYTYDDDGRQVTTTNAYSDYIVTEYDLRGLQTQVSQYANGGTLKARTKYGYDTAGHQTLSRQQAAPGSDNDNSDYLVRSLYGSGGQLTGRVAASGGTTAYAYDQYGRQTKATLPEDSYATSSFNTSGRLTSQVQYEIVGGNTRSFRHDYILDALGRAVTAINQGPDGTFGNGDDLSTRYVYDGAGRQITATDEAGRHVITAYDPLGRKTKVTEDAAGIGRVTEFAYDRAGRMTTLTAYKDSPSTGQENTGYQYNGRGLQTTVTYEETKYVTMAYDGAGNMTLRTDEASVAVAYAYDDVNRLTERKKSGASTDIEKYAYDALGRLVTAKKGTDGDDDAVGQSVFSYDALSRVTQESQAILGGTARAVGYTYDKAGNRLTLQHDGGAITAAYAYDSRDRCTGIDNYNGSAWVDLADYTWLGNAISRRDTTCDYPCDEPGKGPIPKFQTDYQRDGLLRVTKLEHQYLTANQSDGGYESLGTFEYGYDASSNALSAVQTATMDELDADRWYAYDSLNRLITGRVADTQNWTSASTKTSWYNYDDLGNRISHQYRDTTAIGYAHDKANRMTTLADKTQGYDLAGNLTLAYSADRGTSYQYQYDHHNRLTGVYDSTGETRKAAFTYDALGRRIEFINDRLATTTRYFYDGVNEIVETDDNGVPQRSYVHGISYIDERLLMHDFKQHGPDSDDRPYYYVLDRMYCVWLLVDRAGAIVERYAYDEYGRSLIRESAGRGDMDNDTDLDSTDLARVWDATGYGASYVWDPRADLDDDGDCDLTDYSLYQTKDDNWPPAGSPTVAQAFSDVGNPFGFQGRVHFALDTAADATDGTLMFVDHRNRMNDPVTGRWTTRDPLTYNRQVLGGTIIKPVGADRTAGRPQIQTIESGIIPAGLGSTFHLWVGSPMGVSADPTDPPSGSLFEFGDSAPSCQADPQGLLVSWGTLCNFLGICRDCGWMAHFHQGDWISIRSTRIHCCSPHFTPPSGWHYDCFSPAVFADKNCCCVPDFNIYSALHLICDVIPALLR